MDFSASQLEQLQRQLYPNPAAAAAAVEEGLPAVGGFLPQRASIPRNLGQLDLGNNNMFEEDEVVVTPPSTPRAAAAGARFLGGLLHVPHHHPLPPLRRRGDDDQEEEEDEEEIDIEDFPPPPPSSSPPPLPPPPAAASESYETRRQQAKLAIERVVSVRSMLDCCICLSPFRDPIFLTCCGSSACQSCLERCVPRNCPLCRERLPHKRNWMKNRKLANLAAVFQDDSENALVTNKSTTYLSVAFSVFFGGLLVLTTLAFLFRLGLNLPYCLNVYEQVMRMVLVGIVPTTSRAPVVAWWMIAVPSTFAYKCVIFAAISLFYIAKTLCILTLHSSFWAFVCACWCTKTIALVLFKAVSNYTSFCSYVFLAAGVLFFSGPILEFIDDIILSICPTKKLRHMYIRTGGCRNGGGLGGNYRY